MPQYQQNLPASGYTTAQTLQLAYGCFQQLGWTVEYATENRLVGYTKKTWKSYVDHIAVEVENELLTVTSKLPDSASFDLFKKNKKNVNKFISCFETIKASANDASIQTWQTEIEALQKHTEEAIVQEQKDTAEIDAVMNLSKGSKIVTYTIVGINIVVFLLMLINGVSIFEPTVGDIAKWGGNFRPYTTGGDWWRLITAMFVHIGIIHIAFNMYALFYVGMYLEPMLGKWRYMVAYLCTGVFASIASIWWSKDIVSAGASGAIFGLYGVFFALLTTKLIPAKMRSSLLSSIGIFIVYNLVYGAGKQGIDNAAHFGGLLSGFAIGYIYLFSFRSEKFRPVWASALVAIATIVITASYLNQSHNDTLAYQQKLEKFQRIEEDALQPLRNANNDSLMYRLTHISQDKWKEAKQLMDETGNYKLDAAQSRQRKLLKDYVDLRIQQTDLLILSMQQNPDSSVEKDLKEVSQKVQDKIDELQKN
jgi:rhomboid protease GluP